MTSPGCLVFDHWMTILFERSSNGRWYGQEGSEEAGTEVCGVASEPERAEGEPVCEEGPVKKEVTGTPPLVPYSDCEHPKGERQNLGYATRCLACGRIISARPWSKRS